MKIKPIRIMILIFSIVIFSVFGFIVLAQTGVLNSSDGSGGYQLLSNSVRTNMRISENINEVKCATSNSGAVFFIPTVTNTEWDSFVNNPPSNVTPGCTCTSFTYSAWSACNGSTQTRSVIQKIPAACTGGSPVTSRSCECKAAGCDTGSSCRVGYRYTTSNCSGGSSTLTNLCIDTNTSNGTCIQLDSSSSIIYQTASDCSRIISCSTSGCPPGYSCRTSYPYLSNTACQGTTAGPINSTCISTTYGNSTCYTLNGSSVRYEAGSNCTYLADGNY